MQDPFAPFDPVKAGAVPRTQGQQDFDRRLIEAFTPKSKPKAKAKGDVLEEALRLPKGSLLPPGQENKPRKENRQRLSKTWKALEGRGLSAQDLELAQSIVWMSMKDKDGNELSPVQYHRDINEFKPTITEKEALDILRDPLKRAEAEGQRKAWREMRKVSTAQKEGKAWTPSKDDKPALSNTPLTPEQESMTRSHRIEQAFKKGVAPALTTTPKIWQDVRDEVSHRSGKWYAENAPIAQAVRLTGGDPSKNQANIWAGGLFGNIVGGTLDPMAAMEYAADKKNPGFDRVMAGAQAAIGLAGVGQALNSVDDVVRLLPQIGKKAKLDPEALKETAQAILDDIRTNSPKLDDGDVAVPPVVGKQEPPPITREAQAAQEAELRARLEEPPVKGIPDEPVETPVQASTTVEPPLTPEAPQNAIETPRITLDDARQIEDPKARLEALRKAWADKAQSAAEGKEGALASGVDPDFLRYAVDVGKAHFDIGVQEFKAWSKAMLDEFGDSVKPHLDKVWASVKPNKDFGLAAQYEPEGRAASGFLNVEDLAKRGEELVTSGQIVPENVYKKAVYDGHVTPDEIAAIAYRGKFIENRTAVIEQELASGALDDAELGARMAELSTLQSEMGSVLEVGDVAQKTFHQTGQALQVAFSPTYTPVRVKAMAKAYNYGEELDPKVSNRLDTLTNSLTEAKGRISKLESDLEKALKDRATKAGGTRSADPSTKKAALLRAINSDLGLDKYTVTAPGIRGKTTGAVSVPKNKQKAMASYVNSLTKLYIEEGASTLDDVVKRFQGDMPLLSRDDVLGLLNKEYREATLEADVHKLEIDRALRMVQEGAKRARTSLGKRMLNESGDAVLTLQRGMQASLDASLSFIQGLPGLQVSPSSWGKAWVPWFKTVLAKDAQHAMARNNAMLHADPAFKFAKKAGVGFADVSGSYAMQEEVLLGHLTQKARESRIPVVKQYFETLARTQEGGTAFLNKLRLELFKKFAAGEYKDEQTLKDAAMLANILTGRGSGLMADALSSKPFGYIAYAPRYTWSKYQNAALPILLPTKITSKAGRKAAASAWTKQMAAAYLAAPYIAQSLGLDVETDMRSGEYGAITLPNGAKLRLFKHFMEPVAFLTQYAQGRFSRTGNFTKPGYGSKQISGQYFEGKASPALSTVMRQATHNRYDQKTNSGVGFDLMTNPEDVKLSAYELFTPLSLQNAFQSLEEGDNLGAFLSMMGIEYSPSKGTETTASGRR